MPSQIYFSQLKMKRLVRHLCVEYKKSARVQDVDHHFHAVKGIAKQQSTGNLHKELDILHDKVNKLIKSKATQKRKIDTIQKMEPKKEKPKKEERAIEETTSDNTAVDPNEVFAKLSKGKHPEETKKDEVIKKEEPAQAPGPKRRFSFNDTEEDKDDVADEDKKDDTDEDTSEDTHEDEPEGILKGIPDEKETQLPKSSPKEPPVKGSYDMFDRLEDTTQPLDLTKPSNDHVPEERTTELEKKIETKTPLPKERVKDLQKKVSHTEDKEEKTETHSNISEERKKELEDKINLKIKKQYDRIKGEITLLESQYKRLKEVKGLDKTKLKKIEETIKKLKEKL